MPFLSFPFSLFPYVSVFVLFLPSCFLAELCTRPEILRKCKRFVAKIIWWQTPNWVTWRMFPRCCHFPNSLVFCENFFRSLLHFTAHEFPAQMRASRSLPLLFLFFLPSLLLSFHNTTTNRNTNIYPKSYCFFFLFSILLWNPIENNHKH